MIEVLGVSKYYGSKVGVENVTFTVNRGEILGLLGPNGAGKTTTLRMITGYLSPSRGNVRIGGIDLWEEPLKARRQIGYLPERPPVYRDMTVQAYVDFAAQLRGVPARERRTRVPEVMEMVGLSHVSKRLVGNLSKGYQQRVGLAQAIVHKPDVLVFDEPTVGLDPVQINEIRQVVRQLGKQHTVILSSHILPEVQMLCQRVLIIDKGRVMAEDAPDKLAESLRGTRRFRLRLEGRRSKAEPIIKDIDGLLNVEVAGEEDNPLFIIETQPDTEIRPQLFFKLADARLPILELSPLSLSLEDVFLRLVTTEEKGASRSA